MVEFKEVEVRANQVGYLVEDFLGIIDGFFVRIFGQSLWVLDLFRFSHFMYG